MNLHGDSTVKETDSNEHSTFLPAKNIKPIDIYRGYVPSFLYQKSTEDLLSQAHHWAWLKAWVIFLLEKLSFLFMIH